MRFSNRVLLVAVSVLMLLAVSCTPSTPPTTTDPADFVFFSGLNYADAGQYSNVFDGASYAHVTFTISCDNDASFIRVQASADGANWVQQTEYQGAVCRQGLSETLFTAGRYYRAYTQSVTSGVTTVNMVGRFST